MVEAVTIVEALKHILGYMMQLGSFPTELDIPTLAVVVVIVVVTAEILVRLIKLRFIGTTVSSVLSLVIYDAIVKGYSLSQVLSYVLFALSVVLTVVVGLARLVVMVVEHLLKYRAIPRFPRKVRVSPLKDLHKS